MRLFSSRSKKTEAVQFNVAPSTSKVVVTGLALAVLVKNEGAFIAEWLRFHLAAGVDAFIIYDDGSTDDTVTIARNIVPKNALTVIPWAQRLQDFKTGRALHNQGLAFAHAISNFRDRFRWMAFIDIDEFLFPTRANSLPEVLSGLGHVDNILLPWAMFGRQGFEHTPDEIIPNYSDRYRDPYASQVKGILNFKCLVNPSKVTKAYVHGFETNNNQEIWNSNGDKFQFGEHRIARFNDAPALQLNHYYAKSNDQLGEKIAKGSIGHSIFTKHFKSADSRHDLLERRVMEIERDVEKDSAIMEFCMRSGISTTSTT